MKVEQTIYNINPNIYRLQQKAKNFYRKQVENDQSKHKRELLTAEYLLISLTNCGRTWLRFMLGKALILTYKIDETPIVDNLYYLSELNPNIPSIKPIHEYFKSTQRYQNRKIILLVRDPRDAILSTYQRKKEQIGMTLSEYLRSPILFHHINFYNTWEKYKDIPKDFLLIRYEDIKENPHDELQRTINFLNLSVQINPSIINESVQFASFDNMKKIESGDMSQKIQSPILRKRKLENPESYKIRKGKVGGYVNYLSPEDIGYLDQQINENLNPYYGYNYWTFTPTET